MHYIEEWSPPKEVYMFKQASNTYLDLKSVASSIPQPVRCQILEIHALSGCDTVSQLFGVGKDRLYKQIYKNPSRATHLTAFSRYPYEEKSVEEAGLQVIAGLYNMKDTSYEDIRPM